MLPLAAALPDHPDLLGSITYQLVGLLVVFSALGSIWALMELMGAIFRAADARRARALAAAPASRPASPAASGESVRPEVVAVITAAVYASIDASATIVAITPVSPHPEPNLNLLAWSGEGRRQIFASHKLR